MTNSLIAPPLPPPPHSSAPDPPSHLFIQDSKRILERRRAGRLPLPPLRRLRRAADLPQGPGCIATRDPPEAGAGAMGAGGGRKRGRRDAGASASWDAAPGAGGERFLRLRGEGPEGEAWGGEAGAAAERALRALRAELLETCGAVGGAVPLRRVATLGGGGGGGRAAGLGTGGGGGGSPRLPGRGRRLPPEVAVPFGLPDARSWGGRRRRPLGGVGGRGGREEGGREGEGIRRVTGIDSVGRRCHRSPAQVQGVGGAGPAVFLPSGARRQEVDVTEAFPEVALVDRLGELQAFPD